MTDNIIELQQANSPELSVLNKERHMNYREYTQIIKDIYDYAKTILDNTLEYNYTLPIDIKTIAERLGFFISIEDFSQIENQYLQKGHKNLPIAQLDMHEKSFGKDSGKIRGTIHLSDRLNESSIRFAIAHQLGRFALREQNRIGAHLKLDACCELYPAVNANEMLADIFAYALLLPYHLFEEERLAFESDATNWPLNYSDWIAYIRNRTRMPEYYAVLACQELRNISIYQRSEGAKKKISEKLYDLAILDADSQQAALELYAITVSGLEFWGYPQNWIASTLFGDNNLASGTDEEKIPIDNSDIIEFMHDFYITNNMASAPLRDEYPSEVASQIITRLKEDAGISVSGISQITKMPIESINQKVFQKL